MPSHTPTKRAAAAKKKPQKGTGFKAAAKSVAQKQGIPEKQAQAIIAKGAQKASPAAKKANPALKKVARKGTKKRKGGTFK